jgi:hypothetical protein
VADWIYPHRDLDEPPYADGSRVFRPAVPIIVAVGLPSVLGVIDSGSPASVADATLFDLLGVSVDVDEPLFEIPLMVGGRFARTPVFEVQMWLQPPTAGTEPLAWTLPLGARRGWKLPFGVLLGQRGWFDQFPTRINGASSTVEVDQVSNGA